MNPEQFSFSKKPVYSSNKRYSVISDIIPSTESSANYTTSAAQRSHSGRTFSAVSNGDLVKPSVSQDDPLLDYDEQIRAPKFQSKKSLDDIGSVSVKFESNDLMDKSQQQSKINSRRSTKDHSDSSLPVASPGSDGQGAKSTYQPANFDIGHFFISHSPSGSSSPPRQTSSSSLGEYNIESYLNTKNSSTVISNHAPASQPSSNFTTPLPSKKNSNESIYQFTSKNIPKFSMAPLRPIDDPKTPNYVPCVLRTTTNTSFTTPLSPFDTSNSTHTLSDLNTEDAIENGYNLSREHWKPNNSVTNCTDCERAFSLMNRRHHCRKCGWIFCSNCLISKSKLRYDCEFDLDGLLAKVCFSCGKNWSKFLIENFKQVDKTLFPDSLKKSDVITSEDDHHQEQFQQQQQLEQNGKIEGTAVPADWSWSSF